ncbi:MAG: hypothetical protein AAGE18_08805 [Pseudomonadota bacterium]
MQRPAPFQDGGEDSFDYDIASWGPVAVGVGAQAVDAAVARLVALGARIVDVDCRSADAVNRALYDETDDRNLDTTGLHFSLDGLNDVLRGLKFPGSGRLVFVLRAFEGRSDIPMQHREALVDMLAKQAWDHLLTGNLLLVLLETRSKVPKYQYGSFLSGFSASEQLTWL